MYCKKTKILCNRLQERQSWSRLKFQIHGIQGFEILIRFLAALLLWSGSFSKTCMHAYIQYHFPWKGSSGWTKDIVMIVALSHNSLGLPRKPFLQIGHFREQFVSASLTKPHDIPWQQRRRHAKIRPSSFITKNLKHLWRARQNFGL